MAVMPLIAIGVPLALFVGYVVVMAREAMASNRDYAAENPEDLFSKGMDAAWKGKGPPPSEQDRSAHIRSAIIGDAFNPYGSILTPADREAIHRRADAVAARAKALREEREKKSGPPAS